MGGVSGCGFGRLISSFNQPGGGGRRSRSDSRPAWGNCCLVDWLERSACALTSGLPERWPGQPHRHAVPQVRLPRRKSAFGFHLVAADGRSEAENPLHPGHGDPVPRRGDAAVAGCQLRECPAVHQRGQRRGRRADLLADQPVLRRALLQLSVFAVGVMPYITASIIVQLLTVVIPRFEELRKKDKPVRPR